MQIQALPQFLRKASCQEQEQLIMVLIDRIDVDGSNQVSINLRLTLNVIRALSNFPSDSSHLRLLPPLGDSLLELWGMTIPRRRDSQQASYQTGIKGVVLSLDKV